MSQVAEIPGQQEIALGKAYLKERNFAEAIEYFRKALLFYQDDPNKTPGPLLSGYGYAIALGEKNLKDGIAFCKKGLQRKELSPESFLYMAELFMLNRQRGEAYHTLEDGLRLFKTHSRLQERIKTFGVRKKPVVSILDRSHPVNKVLGRIMREPLVKK